MCKNYFFRPDQRGSTFEEEQKSRKRKRDERGRKTRKKKRKRDERGEKTKIKKRKSSRQNAHILFKNIRNEFSGTPKPS